MASWATEDSLLGEAVTEGETLPEGEKWMDETGMVMDSVWLWSLEEGLRVRLVVVAVVSEVAVVLQDRSEIDPDNEREEVFGSACEGFGVGVVSVGEVLAEVGGDGTDVADEGMGGGEFAADGGGKGDVMRGIGEDGWGENGKVGDWRGSAGGH